MLKRLKRKFCIITVSLVGLVLASVLTVMCITTYQDQIRNAKHNLSVAMYNSSLINEYFDYSGNTFKLHPNAKNRNRWHTPTTTFICPEPQTAIFESNEIGITTSEVPLIYEKASENPRAFGYISDLKIYYESILTPDGMVISAIDSTRYRSNFMRVFLASALLFTGGIIIIYLISTLLADIAIKPVKTAWNQQQQFIADASHELKTPLTVILANNNILMAKRNSSIESQIKWIENTQKEAAHMSSLINNLLFLARSDSGSDTQSIMEDVNLSDLCESSLLQFEPVAFENKVTIDSDLAADISLQGDSTQLTQLIHILLDNACKYTPEGEKITMSLRKAGHEIIFSVNNTGTIIPSYQLSHIFERFYRIDKSRSKAADGNGYGLGLSIAKTIAEQHHAKISASSTAANGTTFTVVFRT